MAERDLTQKEVLFSDVPGDAGKAHDILAGWGVEEDSIGRLLREREAEPAATREPARPKPHAPTRHH
ncbi:MAG TPA: hypothetical protein VK422_00460 [Pyrinomonadaceae bacterium]|nr:hypothetical protein [Pyrinomonadaceae bacterium]